MNVPQHTARAARMLATGLLTAAVAVPVGGSAASAATPAWTHAGYGPGNTGYNPAESVINDSTIKKVKARWSVKPAMVPMPGCWSQLRPPVVAAGRVFVADGAGVGAYNAGTGKVLWRNTTVFSDASPELIVSGGVLIGTVYTCGSQSDPDGVMIAFDAKTGAVKWTAQRDAPYAETVIDAGTVVTSGGSASDIDTVTAYRLSDGRVRWSRSDDALARPVAAGGRVLLTHTEHDGSVAVAVGTGKPAWFSTESYSVLAANPAGDRFYATNGHGELVALKVPSGAEAWSVPSNPDQIAADGRRIFVASGTTLTAHDAAHGTAQWAKALGGEVHRPIRAGGLLYAVVDGKPLAILSPTTGAVKAPGDPYKKARGNLVLVGGRLFTTDNVTLRTYTP